MDDRVPTQPPAGCRGHQVGRFVRDAFILAILVEVFFFLGELKAISRLPKGSVYTVYALTPRGWGIASQWAWSMLVMTGFAIIYALPAFMVGPVLGRTLRVVIFLVLVVGPAGFRSQKFIAAVHMRQETLFVRSAPFGDMTVADSRLRGADLRESDIDLGLSARLSPIDNLDFLAVWKWDTRGVEEVRALHSLLHSLALRAGAR